MSDDEMWLAGEEELTADEAVLLSGLIKVARSIHWTLDVVRDDDGDDDV